MICRSFEGEENNMDVKAATRSGPHANFCSISDLISSDVFFQENTPTFAAYVTTLEGSHRFVLAAVNR